VLIARELTKLYEQVFCGNLSELNHWINVDPMYQKCEFVWVVEDHTEKTDSDAIHKSSWIFP